MVFAERVEEGTEHTTYKCFHDGKTYMCVGYCKRSTHEKAQGICRGRKWFAKQTRCDQKVMGDHGVAKCWVFDSVSAENLKESAQAK